VNYEELKANIKPILAKARRKEKLSDTERMVMREFLKLARQRGHGRKETRIRGIQLARYLPKNMTVAAGYVKMLRRRLIYVIRRTVKHDIVNALRNGKAELAYDRLHLIRWVQVGVGRKKRAPTPKAKVAKTSAIAKKASRMVADSTS